MFKKRSGALLVFALVLILGTLFAVNRSLGAKVQEVNDLLYTQIMDSNVGYARPSVASQLKVRYDASNSLVSVGASYNEVSAETAALRDARIALGNLLDKSSQAKALYAANAKIQTAFDALDQKLAPLKLTDTQKAIVADAEKNMTGAGKQIEISGYNEAVRKFNRETLSQFPTSVLRSVTFVGEPELFE